MQSIFDRLNPELFSPPKPLWLKVFDFLRNAIVNGDIGPGEKLNEALIASKLGVSRSPVREAIRVLESENFVETFAHRGPFVRPLSIKEVEEIHIVLKFLQGAAVQLAVKNMNAERKKELSSIIKQLEGGKGKEDIEGLKSISRQFHSFIMSAVYPDIAYCVKNKVFSRNPLLQLAMIYKLDRFRNLKPALALNKGSCKVC